jgi:hypothetical protein
MKYLHWLAQQRVQGGQLRKVQWSFVFHKRRNISFLAKRLSASQGHCNIFSTAYSTSCWSQWPSGLRRRSAAACLLRLWVRIPSGAWMILCCEFCVLSDRGLYNELIALPEESYLLWCVVMCDLEASWTRSPWPSLGRNATEKK